MVLGFGVSVMVSRYCYWLLATRYSPLAIGYSLLAIRFRYRIADSDILTRKLGKIPVAGDSE
jgi:hypothetical protein